MNDGYCTDADLLECVDAADWNAVQQGKETTKEDVERYFLVKNFIAAAYYNIEMALLKVLRNRVPDETIKYLAFKHGQRDSEDNHSDTMEQNWWLRIDRDCESLERSRCTVDTRSSRIWFPCKLFWMKRGDIIKWLESDDFRTQLDLLVSDLNQTGTTLV